MAKKDIIQADITTASRELNQWVGSRRVSLRTVGVGEDSLGLR